MKLTPHMKLAIFIAPFLLVGGYIAGDFYAEQQAASKNLFKLLVQGDCDIIASKCELTHEQLTLRLSERGGFTQIDSNHALETASLSLVDKDNQEFKYRFAGEPKGLNWQATTQLAELSKQQAELKIRLVVMINKGYYFGEFTTTRSAK